MKVKNKLKILRLESQVRVALQTLLDITDATSNSVEQTRMAYRGMERINMLDYASDVKRTGKR